MAEIYLHGKDHIYKIKYQNTNLLINKETKLEFKIIFNIK